MAGGQSAWPNQVGAVMGSQQQEDSLSKLSKCVEGLADFLSELPYWATCDDPRHAPSFIEQCFRWVREYSSPIRWSGDVFASFGSPAEVIKFPLKTYKSAHLAAVSEAEGFFSHLRSCIDLESDDTTNKISQNLQNENVQQLIRDNWELTKNVILDRLNEDWQEAFEAVPSQIARERAQYESKFQSQSGSGPVSTMEAGQQSGQKKNSWLKLPENPDVLKLACTINNCPDSHRSKRDVAREFTEGDEKRAASLLRQLRRHPHLLNSADN